MKPIETLWHGCRFRSRLEARWAVFFEAAGIRWEYEPQGFRLDDGTAYLPDFLLDGKLYVEVKPRLEDEDPEFVRALAKLAGLLSFGDVALLIRGEPWADDEAASYHADFVYAGGDGAAWYSCAVFAPCRGCGGLELAYSGEEHDMGGWLGIGLGKHTNERCQEKVGCGLDGRLRRAFAAARGARFEHGEVPSWT